MGLLALASDDDGPWREGKRQAFDLILSLQICAHLWEISLRLPSWSVASYLLTWGSLLLLVAVPFARWRRWAVAGLALLEVVFIAQSFPLTGNHAYLLCILAGTRAFVDCKEAGEQELFLVAARWIVAIVFFWTGLQKLLNGFYFQGEFFSYYLSRQEHFRGLLQYLISPEELDRLLGYAKQVGDGPYRSHSPALIALSNAVWVAEMGLAVLLVARRTRMAAVWLTLVFMVLTEIAARELVFGAIFLNGLLLFPRRDYNRYLIPLFAAFHAWLILMRLGVLPEIRFS